MRKKNSDFQTGYQSEVGTLSYDKGYFAYVELDDFACWIAAESLDACADKESAKLAVNHVVQEFSNRPSIAKAKLKEYLNNAHQKLKDESKNEMLKVGLVMVVTDYAKIIWAVSGNLRLYHFRDGVFNFRSKDQTIAQLMVDSGNLSEEAVNSREERNNIINYLGGSTEFKPTFSETFRLQDGDAMLLCNSGFWECFNPEQIAAIVNTADSPDALVKQLQEARTEAAVKEAKNALVAAIVVKKAFTENVSVLQGFGQQLLKKAAESGPVSKVFAKHDSEKLAHYLKLIQKAVLVAVPVLILIGAGVMINKQVTAIKLQKALEKQKKMEQLQWRNAAQHEKKAEQWVSALKYDQAAKEYQQALDSLKNLKESKKQAQLTKKLQITKEILTADNYVANGNYTEALALYTTAASEGNAVGYGMNGLNAKIAQCKRIIDMLSLIKEGDNGYARQDFVLAKEKYQLALSIAEQLSWDSMKVEINGKIGNVDFAIERIAKEKAAKELAAKQQLEREKAKEKEKQKQSKPSKDKKTAKSSNKGDSSVIDKGPRLENNGDEQYRTRHYKEALEYYKEAKAAYEEQGMYGKAERVAEKIRDTKRKRLQSLFIH